MLQRERIMNFWSLKNALVAKLNLVCMDTDFTGGMPSKVYRIPIRRLRCPRCRKTISILPDFLIPRYQHTLRTIMFRLAEWSTGLVSGIRQLTQHYVKRFLSQPNSIEMFFRDKGNREAIPQQGNEKAIRLLGMISALGEATFLRRSRGHFHNNFMARFAR